ncbi:MAG: hypothetical protein AAF772_05160, partial [Acidobacteriota bacterium]
DALMAAARGDLPTAPRRLDPNLPRALETVLVTCLAPRPDDRYRRAADLAVDLERILRDETIVARTPALWTRLAQPLRRRRGPAAIAVALLVLGALALVALRAHQNDRRREVRRYGEIADHLRWSMRAAHLGEPARYASTRAGVAQRLDALAAARRTADDPTVRAAIDHALGVGHLALGHDDAAADHLQRAWDAGRRGPTVAYALGTARSRQYGAALQHAANEEGRLRDASRVAAVQRFREPAVRLLRDAGGMTASPDYVEGRLALVESRYDDALAAADRAQAQRPWLYEAQLLRGDVHATRAVPLTESNATIDDAIDAYVQAADAYRGAARAAPSDPRAHIGLCRTLLALQGWVRYTADTSRAALTARADEGLAACVAGRNLTPDDARGWQLSAAVIAVTADALGGIHSDDPRPMLVDAWGQARRAVTRFPRDPQAHERLADIVHRLGLASMTWAHGIDPRPYYDLGIRHHRQALRLGSLRRASIDSSLGHLHYQRAVYGHFYTPADIRIDAALSIAVLQRAIARDPDWASNHSNLGTVHELLVGERFDRGAPYLHHVAAAVASYRRFLAIRGTSAWGDSLLGDAYWLRARHAYLVGEDPAPWMRTAITLAARARALVPDDPWYLSRLPALWIAWAHYRVMRGHDPTALLTQAQRGYQLLLTAERGRTEPVTVARIADGRLQIATIALRWVLRTGEDPSRARAEARRAWTFAETSARTSSLEVQLVMIDHLLARAELALAQPSRQDGDDPVALAADVAARLDAHATAGGSPADLAQRRGSVHWLRALMAAPDSAARRAALDAARASWDQAVAVNGWLAGEIESLRRRADALDRADAAPRVVGPAGDVR